MQDSERLDLFLKFCASTTNWLNENLPRTTLELEYSANKFIPLSYIHNNSKSISKILPFVGNSTLNDFRDGNIELYLRSWDQSDWDNWTSVSTKGRTDSANPYTPSIKKSDTSDIYFNNSTASTLVHSCKSFPTINIILYTRTTFFSDALLHIDGSNVFLKGMYLSCINATVIATPNVKLYYDPSHHSYDEDAISFSNCVFKNGWSDILASSDSIVKFMVNATSDLSMLAEVTHSQISLLFNNHVGISWNKLPSGLAGSLNIYFFSSEPVNPDIINQLLDKLQHSSLAAFLMTVSSPIQGPINIVKLAMILGNALKPNVFRFATQATDISNQIKSAIDIWVKNGYHQNAQDIMEYQDVLIDVGLAKYAK